MGMALHRELIPASAGSGIAPCPAVDKNAINKMPTIEPLKQPGYEYPQSQTNILPMLPVRALVLAPGSGGKSTVITRLLIDKQFYG